MDTKYLTTPKHWYGRGSRRTFLGIAAGISAAGLAGGMLPFSQSIARAGGVLSPVAIPNAAQSGYAWVGNHGLDGDAYQAEFDSLGAQGYRLINLCGYSVSGTDYYASIWDMSPGPAWVGMHRVPGGDYQSQFDSLTAQGFRPVDISGYEMNGSDYYAAIFEQSDAPGGWSAAHGVAGADYQGIFDANVANGLMPLRVSGFTVGGADYVASIWVGDDGMGWAANHGLDNDSYQAQFDSLTGQGMRLVDISGYEMNGSDYYTAKWDYSPKAYWISHHNLSADAYQRAFEENGASGYTLTHVAGYGVGGEARYAGIWGADTLPTGGTVGNGTLDDIVNNAISAAGIPGASIAIARDGLLHYAKGYGTADASTGDAMTVNTRMRIASVSKPITATAIMQLVDNGVMNLSDTVFGDSGWLGNTYGTLSYSAFDLAITVENLLRHQIPEWGSDAYNAMFLQPELSQGEMITYMLDNQQLMAYPGASASYSNFGYCVLGRVIEAATGQTYESYLQSNLLAQCGISDMQIAGDSLAERASNEAVYDRTDTSLGDPYGVPVRRMDAHGGWIATATDLARFLVRVDNLPNPTDVISAASLTSMTTGSATDAGYGLGWGTDGMGWWAHNGALAGTFAIIGRRADGVCYAGIANGNAIDLDKVCNDVANAVTDWSSGTPL